MVSRKAAAASGVKRLRIGCRQPPPALDEALIAHPPRVLSGPAQPPRALGPRAAAPLSAPPTPPARARAAPAGVDAPGAAPLVRSPASELRSHAPSSPAPAPAVPRE